MANFIIIKNKKEMWKQNHILTLKILKKCIIGEQRICGSEADESKQWREM